MHCEVLLTGCKRSPPPTTNADIHLLSRIFPLRPQSNNWNTVEHRTAAPQTPNSSSAFPAELYFQIVTIRYSL